MRLRRPHAVVVAVVLATGAGCGGDPSVSRPASSPAELLQGAGEAAREHGTLTFSFEYVRTRADRPDDPERYGSGEGALDLSERRGRLRLELELGLQSDAARELEQPFELRWDEEWVEAELQGKSRKIARERARETGGLVGRLPDEPEAMLAFLELGSEARLRSEETLGGEPMSVVEFVVAARKAGELGAPAELAGTSRTITGGGEPPPRVEAEAEGPLVRGAAGSAALGCAAGAVVRVAAETVGGGAGTGTGAGDTGNGDVAVDTVTLTVGGGGGAGTVGTLTVGVVRVGVVTVGVVSVGVVSVGAVSVGSCWACPACATTCAAAKPPRATIRPSSLPSRVMPQASVRDVCNYNAGLPQSGAGSVEPVLPLLRRCRVRGRHPRWVGGRRGLIVRMVVPGVVVVVAGVGVGRASREERLDLFQQRHVAAPRSRVEHDPRRREPAPQRSSAFRDDQRRGHAARAVVGERAPEPEAPREKASLELADAAGSGDADAVDARAADAPQAEVVLVLAEVRELDDRRPGLDRGARERVAELVRADLDARRGSGEGQQRERGRDHRITFGRANFGAPGMIASASAPSHCSSSAL